MIGQMLSHYRITAALGAGGMGEVYRATDTNLGRDVAIKVLPSEVTQDEERLARFRREAHLLAALNHPNIAAIHELEEADGTPFLVLELVEGEELKRRVERGAIPVEESLEIAKQIAEALDEAHAKGIVHRDLKPGNIKLTADGKVKVLDFGLAKAWAGDPTGSSTDMSQSPTLAHTGTQAGIILGTAAYMSPEQASGKAVDKRADIWSFGVVLFEMLSGRRLFTGSAVSEILAAVLKEEPPWEALPPDCPLALRKLLRRCLQKRSRERLHDIADARLELEDALSGDEEGPGNTGVAGPPTWQRVLPWGLAAALGVAYLVSALQSRPGPDATWLDIALPRGPGIEDPDLNGRPAVSPDGRMLALSVHDSLGNVQLYLRPFDAAEARALAGTDGGTAPFWSPDSRFIGFFADGKLKKVEAKGGTPVSLCDAPSGRGGSWSPRGVIIFAPGVTTPLHRVPDTGGASTPITRLDASRKDGSHRFPHFLPDGQRFLYLARVSGELRDRHAVLVGSLDDDEETLLLHSAAAATYASGHLLYLREGSLLASHLDLKRLKLAGEETLMARGVALAADSAIAIFSASPDGVLVFLAGQHGARSKLEWYDRNGKNLGTLGDPAGYMDVGLSPDGTQAAVSIGDENEVPDVWLYDLSRDLRTRLTFDPAWDFAGVWSPDGRSLAFSSWRKGHGDLYRMPLEGSGDVELLLASEADKLPGGFSADGTLLTFSQRESDMDTNLWGLPLDGKGEPRLLLETGFREGFGVLSPDGRWMAYHSDESGRIEVYVAAFPTGGQKRQISAAGGLRPQWRGDGREIFYREPDGRLMATETDTSGESLGVGPTEPLFETRPAPVQFRTYSAMPDGQRFLVVTPEVADVSAPLTVVLNWPRLLEE